MIQSSLHCDHKYILSVLILIGKILEKNPQIISKEIQINPEPNNNNNSESNSNAE